MFGVGAGSDAASDRINNAMTAFLLALFAGIVAVGASHGTSAHLAAIADWGAVTPALPVMFLALVRCQKDIGEDAEMADFCPKFIKIS